MDLTVEFVSLKAARTAHWTVSHSGSRKISLRILPQTSPANYCLLAPANFIYNIGALHESLHLDALTKQHL